MSLSAAGACNSTPHPVVGNSIFALIIGIDKYTAIPGLNGAVSDARSVGSYLKTLQVPDDHIHYLINASAKRDAIIRAFKDLQDDTRINRDSDCILIFYAGHGGEKDAPRGWESRDSKVQMILPVDFNNGIVHGIPDRTIARLLDDLAEKKGNNIVVIFDCCHSGGANRAGNRRPRSVKVLHDIPADLDQSFWGKQDCGRGVEYESGFLYKGCRSHVFFAACSTDEKSYEDTKIINGQAVIRGEFTYALVSVLEHERANQLTYAELLDRVVINPLASQKPQCNGVHRDRILFHPNAPSRSLHLRKLHKAGGKYIMDAGTAYGITENAQFSLYRDQQSALQDLSLGTLFVTKVNIFDSELLIPSDAELVALQTKAGMKPELLLHIPQDDSHLDPVFKAVALLECTGQGPRQFSLVEKDCAMLEVASVNDGHLVFNILDKRVTQHGLTRILYPIEIKVENVISVLSAATHYYWHLNRTASVPQLTNKIDIEFTALEDVPDQFDEDFKILRRTRGDNLIKDGIIHVVTDTEDFYGMKITNNTPLRFYVSVFYFDNSDLSITSYYQPGYSGKFMPDPCLNGYGSLTIGYGAGGSSSFQYTMKSLPEVQKVDVGFIKVFLTTEPVDLSNVLQESPVKKLQGPQVTNRKPVLVRCRTAKTCATILIPIVQERAITA